MPTDFDPVRPGEIITSNFVNRLIDSIEALDQHVTELDQRVTALEAGSGGGGSLTVTGFEPVSNVRVGDQLTVFGTNFAQPPQVNDVRIGGVSVPDTNFSGARSSPTELVFNIPQVNVSENGTTVSVRVSTGDAAAVAPDTLLLRPAQNLPDGRIEVAYTGAPSTSGGDTIQASTTYTFTFSFTVFSDAEATVNVSAMVDDSAWTASTEGTAQRTIPAAPSNGVTEQVDVTVTVPSTSSGTAQLQFLVEEVSGGTITDGVLTLELGIGDPVPIPEDRVRLLLSGGRNGASLSNGVVQCVRSQPGLIDFTARFFAGGTYTVEASLDDSSGWQQDPPSPQSITVQEPIPTGGSEQTITAAVLPGTDAGDTDLRVSISEGSLNPPIDATFVQPVSVVSSA